MEEPRDSLNLWDDTHRRCHPDRVESGTPEPPTHEPWQTPAGLERNSRPVDSQEVRARLQDTAGPPPPSNDDDESETIVEEESFGDDNRQQAREAIQRSGFEAVAYYAPIHFYGRSRWGIYLSEAVFFGACAELSASLGETHWDTIVVDMLEALDQHELFHAAAECFALVLEDFAAFGSGEVYADAAKRELSWPEELAQFRCAYEVYFRKEYQRTWPTHECIEERIATALQFRCRFKTPGFRAALGHLLATAPPAYASWEPYSTSRALAEAVQAFATKVVTTSYELGWPVHAGPARILASGKGGFGSFWFPELSRSSLDSKGPVPRWVYRPGGFTTRRFSRALLGNVRLHDLLTGLARIYKARIVSGGKHPAIVFPNGKKVPYANRPVVPNYLVGAIAKALGITRRELLANCLGV